MKKKNIINVMLGALAVLIIPFTASLFIPGWNWSLSDYIFAWVFFTIATLTFKTTMLKVHNKNHRIVAGIVVIAIFVGIWVMLATG